MQSQMSLPINKPAGVVCSSIPDGGDHVPSAIRATRMPLPPAPEYQSPARMVVKMASPFAFRMMVSGIFLITLWCDCVS